MVAGPCHVTDNAEGTTHNEMQAPRPPPGMETTKRMNCSGQDCGDKTFWDTPPRPSQVSTSVLSTAEMEKKYGKKKKALPSPLPAYPEDGVLWYEPHGAWGRGEVSGILVSSAQREQEGSEEMQRPWSGMVRHTRMFTRLQGSQESGIDSHSFQAQG